MVVEVSLVWREQVVEVMIECRAKSACFYTSKDTKSESMALRCLNGLIVRCGYFTWEGGDIGVFRLLTRR